MGCGSYKSEERPIAVAGLRLAGGAVNVRVNPAPHKAVADAV